MEQNKEQLRIQDKWPTNAPVIKTVSGYEFEDFELLERLRMDWINERSADYASRTSNDDARIFQHREAAFSDGAREMYYLMIKTMEVELAQLKKSFHDLHGESRILRSEFNQLEQGYKDNIQEIKALEEENRSLKESITYRK